MREHDQFCDLYGMSAKYRQHLGHLCICDQLNAKAANEREQAAQRVLDACRMWDCSREEIAHYTAAAKGNEQT